MSSFQELVVSLGLLTVPPGLSGQRLCLSVCQPPEEYFCQMGRAVKRDKINFYRENIFLPQTYHKITFHLYRLDEKGEKSLIASLPVQK